MLNKIAKYVAFTFTGIIALAILSCIWLSHEAPKAINAAKQRFHDVGAPMTLEEALPPAVHHNQNAAPIYLELKDFVENTADFKEANQLIEESIFGEDWNRDWGHIRRMDLNDAEWESLKKALQILESAGYFELVNRLSRFPYFRPDWDFSLGPAMLIPEVGKARDAANFKLAAAAIAMHETEYTAALEDIHKVYVISDHMAQGQTLINLLTCFSIRSLAYESLEAISQSSNELISLDPQVWHFSILDFWVPSLDLERFSMGSTVFETMLYDDKAYLDSIFGEDTPRAAIGINWLTRWFFEYDYAAYLNIMFDARDQALAHPIHFKELEAAQRAAMKEAGVDHRILTCMLMPATISVQSRLYQAEARDRLAQTGLALSNYYWTNKKYPAMLNELVPEFIDKVQIDPFSQKPMTYKRIEDGYALYSIGPDCEDNNGYETTDSKNKQGDMIWAGRGSKLKREIIEF